MTPGASRMLLTGLLAAASLAATACSHYTLGPDTPPTAIQRVHIPPVVNRSLAAEVQAAVWQRLVTTVNGTPGMRTVGSEENRDLTLLVTLTGFDRNVGVYSDADTRSPQSYDITLRASVDLEGPGGERLVEGRPFEARETVFNAGDYRNAERQALEPLARRLSRDIADNLLSAW